MAQHMRGQPPRPSRQPRGGGHAQPSAQRVVAHPSAPLQDQGRAARWAASARRGRTSQSPKRWRTSASHQSISRSAPLIAGTRRAFGPRPRLPLPWRTCSLPNPPKIGPPVADVEHHRLVHPQPQPAPQRRGEIVAGGGQVLAGLQEPTDATRRTAHRPPSSEGGTRTLPNEAPDCRLNSSMGWPTTTPVKAANVALIAADHELEEQRQRPRLARPGGHATPRPALLGQEPVSIITRCRPQRPGQRTGELDDHRPGVAHMPVAQPRSRHRQRVLVDDLLLEVLDILARPQRPRRADVADRGQTQRSAGSLREHIHRLYRPTVRNPDHSSFNPCLAEKPVRPGLAPDTTPPPKGEPECIEIVAVPTVIAGG